MTAPNSLNQNRQDQFEESLALLAAGIPLETVLAEAGQDAAWLRPLLTIAGEVGRLQQAVPIPPPNASLQKMLTHGRQLAAASSSPASRPPAWQSNLLALFRGGVRLTAGLATFLLVMVLLGGTLNLAAQRSLPGDTLYWLKQAGENLRLTLTQGPTQREELLETFNRRRLSEIEALLEQGEEARVTFEQTVESLTATTIEVDGVTIAITTETEIIGKLTVGARVQVEAVTRPPDELVGLTIRVLEPGPTAIPTITPTPTLPPTPPPAATLPRSQTTDSLPPLEPTPTPARSQEIDTIELPPTPAADNDNGNTNDDDDNLFIDDDKIDNDNGDDEFEEIDDDGDLEDIDDDIQNGDDDLDDEDEDDYNNNDDFDDGDDFGDDNFNDDDVDNDNDHDEADENENEGGNENEQQDSEDDRSGSSSGDDTSNDDDGGDDDGGGDDDDSGSDDDDDD